MYIANFKWNKLPFATWFFATKRKTSKRRSTTFTSNARFVRRYSDCKYPHSYELSECENKEKSKKISLKNIGKINILTPFVTSQISTRFQREQPRAPAKHRTWSLVSYPVFLLSMVIHTHTCQTSLIVFIESRRWSKPRVNSHAV